MIGISTKEVDELANKMSDAINNRQDIILIPEGSDPPKYINQIPDEKLLHDLLFKYHTNYEPMQGKQLEEGEVFYRMADVKKIALEYATDGSATMRICAGGLRSIKS